MCQRVLTVQKSELSHIFHLSCSPTISVAAVIYQLCENKQGLVLLTQCGGWGPGRTGGV